MNTTIKKDEEDGNKLQDGMNHSNLTTKTSPRTPVFGHNGCVNPDVQVTNWNDDVVSIAILMVLVLAVVASLGNTYLAIYNGNYYSFFFGK
jgi:hypothetical protein